MIPIKLEITNFLSYRATQELEFHGIHLACISGANGAGKSSILDAITWSLFGSSRAKSDDHIVNRVAVGNDEAAEVRFTFELEGVVYRVIRQKKVRKPQSLEFQVASYEGKWKTLSEGKIRETQTVIEDLLRLNYESFTNASFLLQGKADEFTMKTPNQRKEILAELLGVNEWDLLKEMATERRKTEENQLQFIEGRLSEIEEELSQKPARERALATASEHLNLVNSQLQLIEERLNNARGTAAAIDRQQQAVNSLEKNTKRTRENLEEIRETQDKREKDRQSYLKVLDDAEAIQGRFKALQEAEAEFRTWQEKSEVVGKLLLEKKPFELEVASNHAALTQKRRELEARKSLVESSHKAKKRLQEEISQLRKAETTVLAQLEKLESAESDLQEAKEDLQNINSEIALLRQEANQLEGKKRIVNGLEAEEEDVFKNLNMATTALESANRELADIAAINDNLMNAVAEHDTLSAQQDVLMKEMRERRELMDQLQSETSGACPLCGQPLGDDHRQSVIARLDAEGQQMAEKYRENKLKVDTLGAQIPVLRARINSRAKIERNRDNQHQRKTAADVRLQEIENRKKEWYEEGASRLVEILNTIITKEKEKGKYHDIANRKDIVSAKQDLNRQLQQLRNEMAASKTRQEEIEYTQLEWYGTGEGEGLQHEFASIVQQLDTRDYSPDAQVKLLELEQQIDAIGFDVEKYESIKQKRNQLVEAKTKYEELQVAQAAIKPLQENLQDLESQVNRQKKDLAEQTAQYEAAKKQLELLNKNAYDVGKLEADVYAKREEQIAANRLVATSQQTLSVMENLTTQKDHITERKNEIQHQIRRLRMLEKACGRDGVQALLIERALPEIEDDANEILYRLTEGKMQILFETQRQLKTSDRLAETLDIHIGDEVGERPYENYSGGEKFRVNFAIRLALSRILSRRAGARLQTLVIDEGFGSQDPEGRQRLIEAINTIKDDFERILVITHIDSMRDKFPTTIEVVKDFSGSKISVLEG